MNAPSLSIEDSPPPRPVVVFDVLRWTIGLNLVVTPRDREAERERRRRRRLRRFVPAYLHEDIGLPPETGADALYGAIRPDLMLLMAFGPRN